MARTSSGLKLMLVVKVLALTCLGVVIGLIPLNTADPGCGPAQPGQDTTAASKEDVAAESLAERSASDIVSSWGHLGMYLPSSEDIETMRRTMPDSLDALRAGLWHHDEHIRMSCAYVAEQLGSEAVQLGPDLVRRLRMEAKPIVRAYLASARAALGSAGHEAISLLREAFRSEQHEQVRTDLAGALVRLSLPEEQPGAWQWLLDSLKTFPPTPPDGLDEKQVFWERRWGAVRHLRITRGKEGVLLPLLKALRDNSNTPGWVIDQQVSEAIREMEGRTKKD